MTKLFVTIKCQLKHMEGMMESEKFGNSHNNNELNQEMSVDAKTCEWKFEEDVTELQNSYWLPRRKEQLSMQKPSSHYLSQLIKVNTISDGTNGNHVTPARTQGEGCRITSELLLPKMHNLHVLMWKHRQIQNEAYSFGLTQWWVTFCLY